MFPEWIRQSVMIAQALRGEKQSPLRALVGTPESWSSETCPPTEFQLLAPHNGLGAAETLAQLALPALPRRMPGWVRLRPQFKPLVRMFVRPSRVYRYRPAVRRRDPSPDQAWFFLNGLGADRRLLMHNAAYLTELFQRPLILLHNPSCGVLDDFAECTVSRGGRGISEAARMAFAPLYSALKQPGLKRVVLITHSQGSVVTAVLLWLLRGLYPPTADELLEGAPRCPEQRVARALAEKWGFPCAQAAARQARSAGTVRPPLTAEELGRLEIYAFGNCASLMGPVDRKRALPYVESYGNEHDLMARMGVLAPGGSRQGRMGGERFVRREAWGHLLNAHYLYPMECEWQAAVDGKVKTGLRPLPGNRQRQPRLFGYFGGASPAPLAAVTESTESAESTERDGQPAAASAQPAVA